MKYLMLMVCAVALAQDKAPGGVEGRVVHAQTGAPLRKVTVSLRTSNAGIGPGGQASLPATALSALTDEQGRYVIDEAPPGSYVIVAEKPGMLRRAFNPTEDAIVGAMVVVKSGEVLRGMDIRLTPQGVVAGRVTDEDGAPVSGLLVAAMQSMRLVGQQLMGTAGSAQTDDRGEFRLAGLRPGKYVIGVRGQPLVSMGESAPPSREKKPRMMMMNTYYPGVSDVASAKTVEVGPGQVVSGIEMQMKLGPTYRVSGKVVQTGKMKPTRVSMLNLKDGMSSLNLMGNTTSLRADGTFDLFEVPPGNYVLSVLAGTSMSQVVGRADLNVVDAHLDGVVVETVQGMTLKGKVSLDESALAYQKESGKPVVTGALEVALTNGLRTMWAGAVAKVSADGSFELAGVMPGKAMISMRGVPEEMWVKSIVVGEQDVTGREVDLPGTGTMETTVVLGYGKGQVKGLVKNERGDGMPGVAVVVVPEPYAAFRIDRVKMVSTNLKGEFDMEQLPVGAYRLNVLPSGENVALYDEEIMAKYMKKGEVIRVEAGGVVEKVIVAGKP